MKKFKHIIGQLFNTRAAGFYIVLFAASIAIATFIENDYGTSSAQKVIFKAWWFELLLLLFSITILVNIFKFRMIQQKKWALLTFHTSMIIILIGAGVTRYYGHEGVMHIREDSTSNSFLSSDTYLLFDVQKDGHRYQFNKSVFFATLGNNHFKESFLINGDLLEVEVINFIPNPKQILEESDDGLPIFKIVMGGMSGRVEYFIRQGQKQNIRNLVFNFSQPEIPGAINLSYVDDEMFIKADRTLIQTVMATRKTDTLRPINQPYPLRLRSLYTDGTNSFVFGDFESQAKVQIISEDAKVKNESLIALVMNISWNGQTQEVMVTGKKGLSGRNSVLNFDNTRMGISYGSKEVSLPFSLKLYDFIMDKYPGTNSASSYASEVQLIDNRVGLAEDHRIFMNNILDYGGYRFFQSSFDPDEKGTYLSVNHDFWGTWISYVGYILLTLGMILSLFSKKSRFQKVAEKLKKIRRKNLVIIGMLLCSATGIIAQGAPEHIIDQNHAEKLSHLVVQDHKGRMKPVHTMTREMLRKLMRKESLAGQNAEQIVFGMFANSQEWHEIPMIKLGKHELIHKKLNIQGDWASYNDFFNSSGEYILRDEIRRAYNLQPIDRGVLEKELLKLDEKVNIASMIYSGSIFRIIPSAGHPNNMWASARAEHDHKGGLDPVAQKFFSAYVPALQEAMTTNNYNYVNTMIDELSDYQKGMGKEVIPSETKLNAEIMLNKMGVFSKLAVYYILLGLVFLFFLFLSVFRPTLKLDKIYNVLLGLVILGFLFHTLGLGLRWYVSGRAPWSNGYESMIYIAWTSTLAGLLFTRKSLGGLAATMVLAATILLVAHLSYLDPEITPLVPVLKSYWLTIHVSLEAGSYGFLMLGAIIGLINLILIIFLTQKNKENVLRIVREMTYISEMTLIGGLFMVSIGTYLGGVWANESWGRYWGWDAKETWALVTILVYAFILHMRLIPKLGGLYAFNLASIFGWASVIMTYYGVNYYLSGLHSYATGDPVPVPGWVYISVAVIIVISLLAYWKKSKFQIKA